MLPIRTRVGRSHGPRTLQSRQSLEIPPGGHGGPSELLQTPGSYTGRADHHEPPKARVTLDMISGPASTRLLQTYFNCLHPLWPILYKPLYSSSDYANPTTMMAPALVAAIFAIASCIDRPQQYTPNSIVQKFPEPVQFFEETLNLLQSTKDPSTKYGMVNALVPSITNCQVLTILSLQQHGVAEYSRAAILCSLASAMAIELRINRPCDSEDTIQREIQSRLWWNLYVLENMMSTEMGRPIVLRFEESDCPFPSISEADEFELMSAQNGDQNSSPHLRSVPTKLRTISGIHSTIKISAVIERIMREVYGISARKIIRENPSEGELRRIQLWFALQNWEQEMEGSPLKLDLSNELSSVPAAVTNYVVSIPPSQNSELTYLQVMWYATILLHRPFIGRSPDPAAPESPDPLAVCIRAANNICLVLEKYFDRMIGLPCDTIFSVFTAASMLLYQSKQGQDPTGENRRRLKLCVHWLSILGKSWKSAGARHQLLSESRFPLDVMNESLTSTVFDLPQHLNEQPLLNGDLDLEKQPQQPRWTAVTPHQVSEGPGPVIKAHIPSPEDWTFLRDFGDPTDEFYELDVQLRVRLDSGFDSASFLFNGQMG